MKSIAGNKNSDNDKLIAGVDEAGRGPIAGPVFASAVILNKQKPIIGLNDSKKISKNKRKALAILIRKNSLAYSVFMVSSRVIDKINILQATMIAMEKAILSLKIKPDEVKIDGNQVPNFDEVGHSFSLNSVIKGDEKIQEISAASILAKVYRDRYMNFIHYRYPNYNFYINKGYPTKDHVDRLGVFGLSPYHRISFKPCSFYQEKNIYE